MNNRVIKIDSTPKFGVLVENRARMDNSIFSDVYEAARKNVADIIKANNQRENTPRTQRTEGVEKEIFLNTTIAFVGGRGTGKSSSMASFSNDLMKTGLRFNDNSGVVTDREAEFYSLPLIDVNQLNEKETLVGRVIAEMFKQYETIKNEKSVDEKRQFVRLCKQANDLSVKYRTGEWFKSGDELLGNSVEISKIHQIVRSLIECFLELVFGTSKNKYLVVSIDDIDMGLHNSFAVTEEIRRFFSIHHVIVLVSLDLKQLQMIVELNNMNYFGGVKDNDDSSRVTKDLSYRYIEKLFPYSRQHHMPELTTNELLQVKSENFLGDNDKNWEKFNLNKSSKPCVMDAILHLIWRKTLLIPVKNREEDYLLIPRNLRSLCNFVIFLRELPDVAFENEGNGFQSCYLYSDFIKGKKGDSLETTQRITDRYNKLDQNLKAFSLYLKENLSAVEPYRYGMDDEKMIATLCSIIQEFPYISLDTINSKIVVRILRSVDPKTKNNEDNYYYSIFNSDENCNFVSNILSATNHPDAISMGDLMYVLGKIDAKTHCLYIRYLVEVIRTLWSIEMIKDLYGNTIVKDGNEITISNHYRKAVGGLIINPEATNFFYLKNYRNGQGDLTKHWFYYDPETNDEKKDEWGIKLQSFDYINKNILPYMIVCKAYSEKWRQERYSGEPYYHYIWRQSDASVNQSMLHPLAVYTNILNRTEGTTRFQYVSSDSTWKDPFEEVINKDKKFKLFLPMPFHSFDFVYRWYECVHTGAKAVMGDTYDVCIANVFTLGNLRSFQKPFGEMNNYLPQSFIEDTITKPLEFVCKMVVSNDQLHIWRDAKRIIEDISIDKDKILSNDEKSRIKEALQTGCGFQITRVAGVVQSSINEIIEMIEEDKNININSLLDIINKRIELLNREE